MRIRYFATAAFTLLACSGNRPQTVAPRADLFGTWQFDRAATDSLRGGRAEEGERGDRGPRGGIPGAGRMPRGGMPGSDPEELSEMRRVIEAWLRDTDDVALAAADGGITVTYGSAPTLQLKTNGKKLKHRLRDFDVVESKAEWKDGALLIEHQIGRVRIRESYSRANESTRLLKRVQILSRLRPIEVRRFYNRKV